MSESGERAIEVSLDELDLTDTALFRNGFPHAVFSRLRRDAPVWWHPRRGGIDALDVDGFWVLSRYADVQATARDMAGFSMQQGPTLQTAPGSVGVMLTSTDGAQHHLLRKLINAGFTPRMIARLESQARDWAVSIVERALETVTFNFVDAVAFQLPMHMIADIMGIPIEDRAWLFSRSNDFMSCTDPEYPVPESDRASIQAEIFSYGQKLGEEKRRRPCDDVWSILTRAEVENHRGEPTRLSPDELDWFFFLLLLAGSETTRNAISIGLMALLDHPDQLEALRRDPSLQKSATEEIIRWASPVGYHTRTATRDTQIRGVPIAAGERVVPVFPSANRDEEVFEDPFRFDITRWPNPQLAFGGGGQHFCLGAHLARREISILFEELLARVTRTEITGPPRYNVQGIASTVPVSLRELPVRFTPR